MCLRRLDGRSYCCLQQVGWVGGAAPLLHIGELIAECTEFGGGQRVRQRLEEGVTHPGARPVGEHEAETAVRRP